MLRANAGIQGWQGKPGRLPAEETLQFEKRTPPIHRSGALPPSRCCNSGKGSGSLGVAACKLPLRAMFGFLRGRFDFRSERLRFFFFHLPIEKRSPRAFVRAIAGKLCPGERWRIFAMKQPFCTPAQALRRVLDAAAALPVPATERVPLDDACGRIAARDLCARMDQPL